MPCFFVYKGVNIDFVFRQSSKIFLMLLNNYSINSNKRFLIKLLPKNCPTMFYKVSLRSEFIFKYNDIFGFLSQHERALIIDFVNKIYKTRNS